MQKSKKIYVLDTNVFISDSNCLNVFDDNIIVIPDTVIEELDDNKGADGDKGFNVRQSLRNLNAIREEGLKKGYSLSEGIPLENGGVIKVETEYSLLDDSSPWLNKPDNKIIGVALKLTQENENKVIIVSKDTAVKIKANIYGVIAEDYKNEMVDDDYLVYNGRGMGFLSSKNFDKFVEEGRIDVSKLKFDKEATQTSPEENEYFIVTNEVTMGTVLAIVNNGDLVKIDTDVTPFDITARNVGQSFCMNALLAPASEIPLVILKGSAGTAKTFLTLACALEQCYNENLYRKITLTRANVEFDRDIGALPGSEEDKVGPLLRGCMDNLELLVDKKSVEKGNSEDIIKDKVAELVNRGIICTEALGFIRGRSLTRQILYVDEAQNTSVSQMKGILTRVGEGTKLIISGDLNQIDNPRLDKHNNGLAYALKIMSGDPMCAVVGFLDSETTRSPLAARVAKIISGKSDVKEKKYGTS